jgi:hypothetical protein
MRCWTIGFIASCLWPAIALAAEPATAPATQPVHGLRGHYYLPHLSAKFPDYKAVEYDRFSLPIVHKLPDHQRIDPQIAFGAGKGFVLNNYKQWEWLPDPSTCAAIWTGNIHLPKAGTYYLLTVSRNASAAYLNEARVSLCGRAGFPPSDRFVIEDPGLEKINNPAASSYQVPVTIDAPRTLPIAVYYSADNRSSVHGFGIDLYWVTPDARRDAKGRAIAQIVPPEALFAQPPNEPATATTTTQSAVSALRSRFSASRLYYTIGSSKPVLLAATLLDRDGHPVPGRHVHFSALATYGSADSISDPPPTNAQGVTTATLTPNAKAITHVAQVFATVLDDLVDVAQSCEIRVSQPNGYAEAFFPDAYSPYFDSNLLTIQPGLPVVGQPAKFTVPLQNHLKSPVDLYVTLNTLEFNIGVEAGWQEIGRSERLTLRPGDAHVFTFTWTAPRECSHQCFSADVIGTIREPGAARRGRPTGIQYALMADDDSATRLLDLDWRRASVHLIDGPRTLGEARLARIQRNIAAIKPLASKAWQKIAGDPNLNVAPGVTFDPTKARVGVGGGADVSVDGHKIGGVDVHASGGPEQSSDPHKILSGDYDVKVNVGGYSATVAHGSGVLNAPAISRDLDPNTAGPQVPDYSRLRQLEQDGSI